MYLQKHFETVYKQTATMAREGERVPALLGAEQALVKTLQHGPSRTTTAGRCGQMPGYST